MGTAGNRVFFESQKNTFAHKNGENTFGKQRQQRQTLVEKQKNSKIDVIERKPEGHFPFFFESHILLHSNRRNRVRFSVSCQHNPRNKFFSHVTTFSRAYPKRHHKNCDGNYFKRLCLLGNIGFGFKNKKKSKKCQKQKQNKKPKETKTQ